jgi:hypothetical protein
MAGGWVGNYWNLFFFLKKWIREISDEIRGQVADRPRPGLKKKVVVDVGVGEMMTRVPFLQKQK